MKKRVYHKVKAETKAKRETNWEYFDDCFVYQATKKAEEEGKSLSVSRLEEIFKKANETN